MKFSIEDGIRIAEVPVEDFRIILYDDRKKAMGENRCTGGFFGNYKEEGESFTLPVGHLVCDFEATSKWTAHYCTERGKMVGGRFWFDSGAWHHGNELHGNRLATLVVTDSGASVHDLRSVPVLCRYAVSGVPVLRNGAQVQHIAVAAQGWSDSSLYGTYHIFVGVKEPGASTIYVVALRTTSWNLIRTGEAARKFKALGLRDVIKLDGGGSFYFSAAGHTLATGENRRICTILDLGGAGSKENPYKAPTSSLRRGSGDLTGVCWLQYELTEHGFPCTVDGIFGAKTEKQLEAYQAANGLDVDGSCGPATRASLLSE